MSVTYRTNPSLTPRISPELQVLRERSARALAEARALREKVVRKNPRKRKGKKSMAKRRKHRKARKRNGQFKRKTHARKNPRKRRRSRRARRNPVRHVVRRRRKARKNPVMKRRRVRRRYRKNPWVYDPKTGKGTKVRHTVHRKSKSGHGNVVLGSKTAKGQKKFMVKRKGKWFWVSAATKRKRRKAKSKVGKSMAKKKGGRKSAKRVAAGKKAARTRKRNKAMRAGSRKGKKRKGRKGKGRKRGRKRLSMKRRMRGVRALKRARKTIKWERAHGRGYAKRFIKIHRMRTNPGGIVGVVLEAAKAALPVAASLIVGKMIANKLAMIPAVGGIVAKLPAMAQGPVVAAVLLAAGHFATKKVAFLGKHRGSILLGLGLNLIEQVIKSVPVVSGLVGAGEYIQTGEYLQVGGDVQELGAVQELGGSMDAPIPHALQAAPMGHRGLTAPINRWAPSANDDLYQGIFSGARLGTGQ
jgi:hypothetical protein